MANVRELLQAVPLARDIDLKIWYAAIIEMCWLIVGRSGSGKSGFLWGAILSLLPAWLAGIVEFYGLDAKKLELSIGREVFDEYANTDEGMVEVLEKAVRRMEQRGQLLEGKKRTFTPSIETPLIIVCIDEQAPLSMMPNRTLQKQADEYMWKLVMQGRAIGISTICCTQEATKEIVKYRDMFNVRIAAGLNNGSMVDLVLGQGMRDAGALADQIPIGAPGAGCAYVLDTNRSNKPILVRAPLITDRDIREEIKLYTRQL
jgi:DNA segregation ATPase FtsK/SpoIIIE, S-DNA-T family